MLTEEQSKVGSIWDYNMHYPDFSYPAKQPGFDQHGMYGVDPLFVNPQTGNFKLLESSPAIDAGIAQTDFLYDIEGNSRPSGERWDIGAFEFISGNINIHPEAPNNLKVE